MEIDWTGFLGRGPVALDPGLAESVASGRSILITGAGGSIGSGLARKVLAGKPRVLVLLDSSEGALYECYRQLLPLSPVGTAVVPAVGSVSDSRLMERLFKVHRSHLVLHAAAHKHVPLMEQNPFSALANNSIGTYRLVLAGLEAEVSQLVMLSTDKAASPRSVMGASKRIAEQVVLAHASKRVRMNAVRLGNVLGSAGSVVPIFLEQVARGLPLTVTHPAAERYFLTPEEAEAAVLRAAASLVTGRILVADCGEALRIVDLAKFLAKKSGSKDGETAELAFIGHRAGDKLSERLVSEDEQVDAEGVDGMRVVASPHPSAAEMAVAIERLEGSIARFDFAATMTIVRELAPGYEAASGSVHSATGPEEVRP